MHAARVQPDEERLARALGPLDEVERGRDELLVHRLHALASERPRVRAALLADAAEPPIFDRVIRTGRDALQHAPRAERRLERGVLRIIDLLRELLSIQVIEVAVELIEPMHRRQVLVAVAQVVLAELPGRVAQGLQHFGERRCRRLDPERAARGADGREAAPDRVLTGDESRTTRGARRLRVVIREHHSFAPDAIEIRRGVTHYARLEKADVRIADVVAEDDEDVRAVGCRGRGQRGRTQHQPQHEPSRQFASCPCVAHGLYLHVDWTIYGVPEPAEMQNTLARR